MLPGWVAGYGAAWGPGGVYTLGSVAVAPLRCSRVGPWVLLVAFGADGGTGQVDGGTVGQFGTFHEGLGQGGMGVDRFQQVPGDRSHFDG